MKGLRETDKKSSTGFSVIQQLSDIYDEDELRILPGPGLSWKSPPQMENNGRIPHFCNDIQSQTEVKDA